MIPKASYKALAPRKGGLRVENHPLFGEVVIGDFYALVDVFVPYSAAIGKLKIGREVTAPHLDFANSNSDVESILAFTAQWGPLEPSAKELLEMCFPEEQNPSGEIHFAFRVEDWRRKQEMFKRTLETFATKEKITPAERERLREAWPRSTLNPYRKGGLYVDVDFGYSLEQLHWAQRQFDPTRRVSDQQILKRAKGAGLFVPRDPRRGEFQLGMVACTLWDAFWLMLWFDLQTDRRQLGMCENPNCGEYFTPRRSDQRFCSHGCAQRVASLKYYHSTGKKNRNQKSIVITRLEASRTHR